MPDFGNSSGGSSGTITLDSDAAPTYYVFKDGSNYTRVKTSDGTSVTNSSFSTILNGAIDAVTALTEGGKIILTGESAFALATSGVINLKSKVTIEGLGHGTKITKADSGDAISVVGTSGSEVVNWAVKNLRIIGPSVVGTQVAGSGIDADFADKGLIENCDISGFGSASGDGAVDLRRCQEVITTKCRLHDSKNGYVAGESTGTFPEAELCKISDSFVYDNFDDGIHTQHCARMSIINNHVYSNDEAGIDVLGDDSDTVIGNVVYDNIGTGIEVGNTTGTNDPDKYHTVTGNTSRDNDVDGILLTEEIEYCVISNNTCKGNTGNGIKIAGTATRPSQFNNITSNISEGNTLRGIYIVNGCNNNLIAHNNVRNNASRGIYIANTTTNPTLNIVAYNQVKNNTTAQIDDSIVGSTNIVQDNFT